MRDQRLSARQRGYDRRWEKARKVFLLDNPLCIDCLANGIAKSATDVDHDEPHRGDMVKFWDESNWRARCHECHSTKTALEDGAFGHGVSAKAVGGCGVDGMPTHRNHPWMGMG